MDFVRKLYSLLNHSPLTQRLSSRSLSYSSVRIIWFVASAVFITETFVMFLLFILPPMPPFTEAIVDSALLAILISLVFFSFLFRPLSLHIIEQAKIQKTLRRHKDMLQTVFDGISDPLILLDEKLNIKMINQAATAYYDVDLDNIFGMPCSLAFKSRGMPCDECEISSAVKGNKTVVFERSSPISPDRVEQVVIYRSQTQTEKPGAVIIRISDVTEAKNMERQMIQQEKMASLGLLISSVVHEVNNPNNMISFNLPILKDYFEAVAPVLKSSENIDAAIEHLNMDFDEFQKDIFELIDNIQHGSDRINTIVSQLKEFSRINKHKKMDWIDINQVVRKAVAICNGQIKSAASSFNVDIPEDFPKIYSNGEYLEQVLINLLVNASQALDKNDARARITLKVSMGPDWREHTIFEVGDNGCGMTAEVKKRIFEPLFTTKDSKSGTGLGLYVCHNLIENLGGRIEVESERGQGSIFRVILTDRDRRLQPRGLTPKP